MPQFPAPKSSRAISPLNSATASSKAAKTDPPSFPATRRKACSSKPCATPTPTCKCRRTTKSFRDEQIADFVAWVKMGAPDTRARRPKAWPRKAGAKTGANIGPFKPIKKQAIPEVSDSNWVANPIDAFILAKLGGEQSQTQSARRQTHSHPPRHLRPHRPAPDAGGSRRPLWTTLRPMLSPRSWTACWTPRNTASVGAASGWTRPAMPTPRATSSRTRTCRSIPMPGLIAITSSARFNEDKPYNRFVIEQLGRRQIACRTKIRSHLAALGFLTLGPAFQRQQQRHHQRSHRRGLQGFSRPDRHLRPLPRPQVRSHSAKGLLFVARHF